MCIVPVPAYAPKSTLFSNIAVFCLLSLPAEYYLSLYLFEIMNIIFAFSPKCAKANAKFRFRSWFASELLGMVYMSFHPRHIKSVEQTKQKIYKQFMAIAYMYGELVDVYIHISFFRNKWNGILFTWTDRLTIFHASLTVYMWTSSFSYPLFLCIFESDIWNAKHKYYHF